MGEVSVHNGVKHDCGEEVVEASLCYPGGGHLSGPIPLGHRNGSSGREHCQRLRAGRRVHLDVQDIDAFIEKNKQCEEKS